MKLRARLTPAEIDALLYAAEFLRDRDPAGLPYDTIALAHAEAELTGALVELAEERAAYTVACGRKPLNAETGEGLGCSDA